MSLAATTIVLLLLLTDNLTFSIRSAQPTKTIQTTFFYRNADLQTRLYSAIDCNGYYKVPRVYLENSLVLGQKCILEGKEAHYISTVMRLKVGSSLRVFNGNDGEFLCSIITISSDRRSSGSVATLEIKKLLRPPDGDQDVEIVLLFSPIKKPKMKLLLEKVTELGVHTLIPIVTQNCNNLIDSNADETYNKIILESTEQCERLSPPKLEKQIIFKEFFRQYTAEKPLDQMLKIDHLFVCRERSHGDTSTLPIVSALHAILDGQHSSEKKTRDISIKKRLFQRHTDKAARSMEENGGNSTTNGANRVKAQKIGIFVGPEGGFTAEEISIFQNLTRNDLPSNKTVGFVSLGKSVLRAETAAFCAVNSYFLVKDSLDNR